ncbi:MAG: hypothetical protein PF517_08815, partial [Salinivirgaceae bacterium]|nr:hypothetical protein [Salinivirgaceae bacterium]
YERFYDGQNTFEKIKWDAEYLLYYFKNEDAFWDTDGLSLTGHWWIELTLPKIRKGTYVLNPYWFGGGNVSMYIDGVFFREIDLNATFTWNDYTELLEPIIFTETEEHTLKLKTNTSSSIWWDRIRFTPI